MFETNAEPTSKSNIIPKFVANIAFLGFQAKTGTRQETTIGLKLETIIEWAVVSDVETIS